MFRTQDESERYRPSAPRNYMKIRVQIEKVQAWSFASTKISDHSGDTMDVSVNNIDIDGNHDFPITFEVIGESVEECRQKVCKAFEKLVNDQ